MKKILMLLAVSSILFTSCVSNKKYAELEGKQKNTQDLLNTCTIKLNSCESDKSAANSRVSSLEDQIKDLKRDKEDLKMFTKQGGDNLEKTLESLKEKDLKITRLQDALTQKDSVTLALVTSLKKEVGLNDEDIEINVEKGVVFISLSDKVLFKSGSYHLSSRANEILGKVATVINGKPDFEALVEGHTDNDPYKKGILIDNWDLSAKRSTAVVRKLVELGANPSQMIAAGRSEFVPLVPNDSAENKSTNRRTKIYILPKIDQFYEMIETEMKNLSEGENVEGGN